MGVEHGMFCHKCQEWIDGHKNWSGYFGAGPGSADWKEEEKAYVDRPPTWKECESDKKNRDIWWYWNMRMFWFLYKHKNHGSEVCWLTDGADQDEHYKLIEKYKEVHGEKDK